MHALSVEPNHMGRPKQCPKESIYVYLWYLANTVTFRQLGHLFGMAKSTPWRLVRRVSDWLLSIADDLVGWPVEALADNIKQKFKRTFSIPNIIGCIDCTHITIKAPSNYKEVYFDRKSNYSIILQAIVDAEKKFLRVSCGEPGSMHDFSVLRSSNIYSYIYRDKESFFPRGSFLLGDSAYPVHSWLVTPFKVYGNLSDSETNFNDLHKKGRIIVANAFGLFKGRFRRLKYFTEQTDLVELSMLITSSCVLHNIGITFFQPNNLIFGNLVPAKRFTGVLSDIPMNETFFYSEIR